MKSSNGTITASQLTHRITIQKLTTTTNENGFTEERWDDFVTVWASKSNLTGREFWSAKTVQSEKTVEFVVRYAKYAEELDSKNFRIIHGKKKADILNGFGDVIGSEEIDKIYNITFIDNSEYRNVFVKIQTLELVA